ncbi:anti-phage dCTP deaminase [Phreatobacter sp.]|uniref:anti-phage dCTP deaminase n=1 Tax=Phreatobacter sp. TaxID=1966341 RepID=UPI003F70E8BB
MTQTKISRPELFFGLVGPIGVNLEEVASKLEMQLSYYQYDVDVIHITDILKSIDGMHARQHDSLSQRYADLIDGANAYREKFQDPALMAKLAMIRIDERRGANQKIAGPVPQSGARGTAYVIRQLKRPEEIQLLRQIYGKQVFQISAYADPAPRRSRLAQKMRDFDKAKTRQSDFERDALSLINRDENEGSLDYGQRLRDVFPLADVFIDATSAESIRQTMDRFLKIIFGYNFHSPSRDEYGMYIAKSASLRSVDLSRQVGAAIFNRRGEVKVLGCNEVPSPKGGTFWENDDGDNREFIGGEDTNEKFKLRLLSDVLSQLAEIGYVDKKLANLAPRDFLKKVKSDHGIKLDKSLLMMEIIEYGRILHAEMNAITDAARCGIPLENTTLYCTTFPCHLCAKHILSSGIRKVVYIEPYPKIYATELYSKEISLSRSSEYIDGKIVFEPLVGIAPFRYRDFFEKSKRKDENGKASEWQDGSPLPLIEIYNTDYIKIEHGYLLALVDEFKNRQMTLPAWLNTISSNGENTG